MISLNNVFVKYTKEFYALSNFNLKANKGDIIALIGPENSGKTCLLRLLAGLEKQEKGDIYIKDISLEKLDYKNDISMGYIPYKTNFFDKKSVYDNLKYVLEIRKIDKKEIEEKINRAIIDFKLENIINEKIYKLTSFQKYIVSIARLSFRKLDIALIDNIFEELTTAEIKEVINLFKKYFVSEDSIVLLATSSDKVANQIAKRKIYLKYGATDKEIVMNSRG